MNRITSITAAVLLIALGARDAAAQWNVARFDDSRTRAYTTMGLDPAIVATAGVARVVPIGGHAFQLTADAGVVAAHLDVHDFRARLGTQTSLVQWRSWHLTGSATFITRGTDNAIYRGFNFGADLSAGLGVHRPRWFAAGEAGKDKAIITHITHSDWYRRNVYPDAKDGWYLDAGGTYHYGFAGGVTLGRVELAARGGWLRTEKGEEMTPPMYATVGVGVGF